VAYLTTFKSNDGSIPSAAFWRERERMDGWREGGTDKLFFEYFVTKFCLAFEGNKHQYLRTLQYTSFNLPSAGS